MTLEQRLRFQYDAKMAGSSAPVFASFETYAQTLPRRVTGDFGNVLVLYQLPFWGDQDAVRNMAVFKRIMLAA